MSDLVKCPCCHEASSLVLPWKIVDADGRLTQKFQVVSCKRCGTGLTTPSPSSIELGRYYSQGIYTKRGGRGSVILDWLLNKLQRDRLKEIGFFDKQRGRLLDLGCGKGRFLRVAKSRGWDVYGQDITRSQLDAAVDGTDFSVWEGDLRDACFDDGYFQVVTAWHVLEHIENIEELVQEIRRVIMKDGVFALEVPNFGSWQAIVGKGGWFQLDVPRHLRHFTVNGLYELFERNGFRICAKHSWSIELGPFGFLQSLLNRIGCMPQVLFLFLKRTNMNNKKWLLVMCISLGVLLAFPIYLLEYFASKIGKGGVIRIVAVKC